MKDKNLLQIDENAGKLFEEIDFIENEEDVDTIINNLSEEEKKRELDLVLETYSILKRIDRR